MLQKLIFFLLLILPSISVSFAEVAETQSTYPNTHTPARYTAPQASNSSSCRQLAEENPELKDSLNLDGGSAPSLSLRTRAKKCVEGVGAAWADTLRALIIDPAKFIIHSTKETHRFLDACSASMECKKALFIEAYGREPSASDIQRLAEMDRGRLDVLQRNAMSRLNSSGMQNQRYMEAARNQQWLESHSTVSDPSQETGSFWALLRETLQRERAKWSCLTPEAAQELTCYYIAQIIDPAIAAGMVTKAPKLAKLVGAVSDGGRTSRAGAQASKADEVAGSTGRAATLARNAALSNTERIKAAEELLGQPLTPGRRRALIEAHNVGSSRPGAGIGTYTRAEIHTKARILADAGFSSEQRRALMEAGLAGSPQGYLSGSVLVPSGRSGDVAASAARLGRTSPQYALMKPQSTEQFNAARAYWEARGEAAVRRGGDLSGARENFLYSGNVDSYMETFSRGTGEYSSRTIETMRSEVTRLRQARAQLRRDNNRSLRGNSEHQLMRPESMYSDTYINHMERTYQRAIEQLNETLSYY